MVHNDIQGNVIGEVWRAQEAAKEIVYFTVQGQARWFRVEYAGPQMLERANYMADRLKAAAAGGSGTEVGVDFDELKDTTPPTTTFNLVRYVQVKL